MRAVRLAGCDVGIPIRVEFMMTRDDMVNALAWHVRNFAEDEALPDLPKPEAVAVVRDVLYQSGSETSAYWTDSVYAQERRDQIQAWAEAAVERVFGSVFAQLGR